MTARVRQRTGEPIRATFFLGWIPPSKVEYVYYFSVAYSIAAAYLGVEISLLAPGITVILAGYCFQHLYSRAKEVFAPITLLLACIISFILIQIAFHGVSVTDQVIRDFVLWFCGMIIVQSLCLRRGFSYRFPIILFLIGLLAAPYLELNESEERVRAAVELGGYLSHTGGLAQWFSFSALFFAIFGLESKRNIIRVAAWVTAIGCVFVAGLTVSRGPLLGLALSLAVAFRVYLKRAFVPALTLIILSWIVFETGLFGTITARYEARGMEETGRFLLWPMVLERIAESPFIGVGHANIATYLPDGFSIITTPHNAFLFFALSSGFIPLAFWVAFWIRATWRSFSHDNQSEYGPYRLPFLLFAFVTYFLGDINAAPWALLSLAIGASPDVGHRRGRVAEVRRILSRKVGPSLQASSRAAPLR